MILNVEQLSFRYNSTTVLHHIDLQTRPGQLTTVLGPNGVGKTTLLKCIGRLHRSSGGTVLVEKRSILKMRVEEIARYIGYVAQQTERSRLTVFDAVMMGRKPHIRWKMSKRDMGMVESVLGLLELERFSLRYIDELSGGELQKVAIGRALVQEPRLMLLDEPTSALDLRNQMNILQLIRRIVDEHRIGAVMTMHDLNSALRYGDQYCFLKNGTVHSICRRDDVSAQIIEDVYGLSVTLHYIDGCPVVLPKGVKATLNN